MGELLALAAGAEGGGHRLVAVQTVRRADLLFPALVVVAMIYSSGLR
ncbi:hypothetical protein [Streptomyces dysideae]|nr:hypothetical protein [Streptomyces dysideae]